MAYKVKVVGVGPGSSDYTTPIARNEIKKAEVLVGGQRLLDVFAGEDQVKFPVKNNLPSVVKFIKQNTLEKRVAVLVSGDTGVFSLADYLARHMDVGQLEFIPGISSVQLMFARLKRPWTEASILSMHGRAGTSEILPATVEKSALTAVLTGRPWTPRKIAELLAGHQITDLEVAIGKDLSYPGEKLIYTTLGSLLHVKEGDYNNSIMVIFNE